MSAQYLLLGLVFLLCGLLWNTSAVSIPARVVHQTTDSNLNINTIDFAPISNRLIEQRANESETLASEFRGPEVLRPLVGQCFLHDDGKYVFRVCPFSNVTQHEKSQYAFNFLTTSFHAILGIWRQWRVTNNTFHSLIYLQGDQCEQGIARKVHLQLHCSNDWTMLDLAFVKNVTEVHKCVYQVELASALFCELGSVYSRLDSQGKMEWDALETFYQKGDITANGYKHYLRMLLAKYGLTFNEQDDDAFESGTTMAVDVSRQEDKTSADEMSLCEKRVHQLEQEISELKTRFGLAENNKTVAL